MEVFFFFSYSSFFLFTFFALWMFGGHQSIKRSMILGLGSKSRLFWNENECAKFRKVIHYVKKFC